MLKIKQIYGNGVPKIAKLMSQMLVCCIHLNISNTVMYDETVFKWTLTHDHFCENINLNFRFE